MLKTKKQKLSNKRRSNKKSLNKRRLNIKGSNKKRSNIRSSNKKRLNKKRSNKKYLNKRQKGGNIFRNTLLPIDIVNTGRGISYLGDSLINNIKGISVSPSPYPTADQPIDNPVNLA